MKNGNNRGRLRRSFYTLAIICGSVVMAAMITAGVRAERPGSSVSPVAATQSAVAELQVFGGGVFAAVA